MISTLSTIASSLLLFPSTWKDTYAGVARRAKGRRQTTVLFWREIGGVGKIELVAHIYRETTPEQLSEALVLDADD